MSTFPTAYWLGLAIAIVLVPAAYGLPGDGVYKQAKSFYAPIPRISRTRGATVAQCAQACVGNAACLAYGTIWNNKQKQFTCATYQGDSTYPGASYNSHRNWNWYEFVPPEIRDYIRRPNQHVDALTPLATHTTTLAPACAALCDSDVACMAFEVDYSADCFLYETVDVDANVINETRSTVYVHIDVIPPDAGCLTPIVQEVGMMAVVDKNERYGWLRHKYNWNTRTPTLEQCLIECDNSPGCVAVNYYNLRRPQCYRLRVGPLNLTMQGYSKGTFAYRCVAGCTDSMSLNYDPAATHDDGSCSELSSATSEPAFTGNGTLLRKTDCFVRPLENPDYSASEIVQSFTWRGPSPSSAYPFRELDVDDVFLHADGTFTLAGTTYPFATEPVEFWAGVCVNAVCAFVKTSDGSVYLVGGTKSVKNNVCLTGTSTVGSNSIQIPFPKPVSKISMFTTGLIVLYDDGSVQMCGDRNNGYHTTSDPLQFRDVVGAGGAVDVGLVQDFSAYLTPAGDLYTSGLSQLRRRCVSTSSSSEWTLYQSGVAKMIVPLYALNKPAVGFITPNSSFYWCIEGTYDTERVFDDVQDVVSSEMDKETLYLFNNGQMRQAYAVTTIGHQGICSPNGFRLPQSSLNPVDFPQFLDDQYGGMPIVMENVASLVPGNIGAVVAALPEASMPMNVVPNEVYVHGTFIYEIPLIAPQPLSADLLRPFLPARNDPTFSRIIQADASGTSKFRSIWLDEDGQVWSRDSIPQRNDGVNPEKVTLPGTAVQVAAGYQGNFALLENGDVYGWGQGGNSILCGPTNVRASAPVLVGTNISYIHSYGKLFYRVHAADGSVTVCGRSVYGMAGAGGSQTGTFTNAPVIDTADNLVTGVVSLRSGFYSTAFIFANGVVHFAGSRAYTCYTGVTGSKVNLLDGLTDVTRIGFSKTMLHYQQSDGITRMCGNTFYEPSTQSFNPSVGVKNHLEIASNFDEVSMDVFDNIFIRRQATGAVDLLCFSRTACPIGTLILPSSGFTRIIESGVQEVHSATIMTLFFT